MARSPPPSSTTSSRRASTCTHTTSSRCSRRGSCPPGRPARPLCVRPGLRHLLLAGSRGGPAASFIRWRMRCGRGFLVQAPIFPAQARPPLAHWRPPQGGRAAFTCRRSSCAPQRTRLHPRVQSSMLAPVCSICLPIAAFLAPALRRPAGSSPHPRPLQALYHCLLCCSPPGWIFSGPCGALGAGLPPLRTAPTLVP